MAECAGCKERREAFLAATKALAAWMRHPVGRPPIVPPAPTEPSMLTEPATPITPPTLTAPVIPWDGKVELEQTKTEKER